MNCFSWVGPGCVLLSLLFVFSKAVAEPTEPCGGAVTMFSLVDRPTIADSPCTVPVGQAIFEGGFQNQKLIGGGHSTQFPTTTFRVGLPAKKEFYALLPNYIYQSRTPTSGLGPASIGFKQIVFNTEKSLFTLDSLITPPSGSVNYGSQGLGGTLSGIFNYNLNDKLSFTCQLSWSSQTGSELNGGKRFTTVNPDAFLTLALSDKLQAFGEVYGQSKTGVGQGSGFAAQVGMLYLFARSVVVDVEAGQRIDGLLGNYENYVGAGLAVQY